MAHEYLNVLLTSVLQPAIKYLSAQLGISDCVLDVLVAHIQLQRPGITPFICELKPASVTQHMRVRLERQPCFFAQRLQALPEAIVADWRAPRF
jgi:hypothetical protein